jgi:hypothetical protein
MKKKLICASLLFQTTSKMKSKFTFANRKADRLGDPGVNGRIIFRCIFRKCDVGVWTGSSWLRIGRNCGLLLVNAELNLRVP